MTDEIKDGIFKIRQGNHGSVTLQVPVVAARHSHYWRFYNEQTGEIRFVPAKS